VAVGASLAPVAAAAPVLPPEEHPMLVGIVQEMRSIIGKHIKTALQRFVHRRVFEKPRGCRCKVELGLCVTSIRELLFKGLVPKKSGYRTRPTGRRFVYLFDSRSALEQFLSGSALVAPFAQNGVQKSLRVEAEWPSMTPGFTTFSPLKLIWHEQMETLTFDGYWVLQHADGTVTIRQRQAARPEDRNAAEAGGPTRLPLR
jgi:hypothetical protein